MYHSLTIVGNVGRDPEMRYLPNGTAVTSFTIASNHQYTSNTGETVKQVVWFRVSVFGKQGESCNQYLTKGSKVLIEGRLNPDPQSGGPRVWIPKDGSPPRASFDVTANVVRFLSTRNESSSGDYSQNRNNEFDSSSGFIGPDDDDENLPF